VEHDLINLRTLKGPCPREAAVFRRDLKSETGIRRRRVEQKPLSGFRVFYFDPPHLREFAFARIVDSYRDDFVTPRQPTELILPAPGTKIREDDDNRPVIEELAGIRKRQLEVGTPPLWPERQHVTNYSQGVSSALCRADDMIDSVREDEGTDAVVVSSRRQGQYRRDFHRSFGFVNRIPELHGTRPIDDQQQRYFALFVEQLHIRLSHPGGDIPVNRTKVISVLVCPHFSELDTLTAEDRPVFAGK
jgi:hypothetical protein